MANCPVCGSSHIQIKYSTEVNWGRAFVGWAAFGAAGGVVGAITGDERAANFCLDCSACWQPKTLYIVLKTIEYCTGNKIDLAKSTHRDYFRKFNSEMGPYLTEIIQQRRTLDRDVDKHESSLHSNSFCTMGAVFVITTAVTIREPIVVAFTLAVAVFINILHNIVNGDESKEIEKKVREFKEAKQKRISYLQEDFDKRVKIFINQNPLN
jgi:hypothetical protein